MAFEIVKTHKYKKGQKKYLFREYFDAVKQLNQINDIRDINSLVICILEQFKRKYDRNRTTVYIPIHEYKWKSWIGYDFHITFFGPERSDNYYKDVNYKMNPINSEDPELHLQSEDHAVFYDENFVAHNISIDVMFDPSSGIFPVVHALQRALSKIYRNRLACIYHREQYNQMNNSYYQKYLNTMKDISDNDFYMNTLAFYFKEYIVHQCTCLYEDMLSEINIENSKSIFTYKWYKILYMYDVILSYDKSENSKKDDKFFSLWYNMFVKGAKEKACDEAMSLVIKSIFQTILNNIRLLAKRMKSYTDLLQNYYVRRDVIKNRETVEKLYTRYALVPYLISEKGYKPKEAILIDYIMTNEFC